MLFFIISLLKHFYTAVLEPIDLIIASKLNRKKLNQAVYIKITLDNKIHDPMAFAKQAWRKKTQI
jgi:hypothetical protein